MFGLCQQCWRPLANGIGYLLVLAALSANSVYESG
jgi:hypothetical protein